MPFPASAVSIMIASPGDVHPERDIIRKLIHEWNDMHALTSHLVLLPVAWDTHSAPLMGDRGQEIINKQVLSRCDLLVAVFWTRIGTRTGDSPSGTVEEITRSMDAGKPTMIYFSNTPAPPSRVTPEQYAMVQNFRSECMGRGLVCDYDSHEEFEEKFRWQLHKIVTEHFVGETEFSQKRTIILSSEATQMLLSATKQKDGVVMYHQFLGGCRFAAGERVLYQGNDGREEATWKGALEELLQYRLVEDRAGEGSIFFVTRNGYLAADQHNAKLTDTSKPAADTAETTSLKSPPA